LRSDLHLEFVELFGPFDRLYVQHEIAFKSSGVVDVPSETILSVLT
jgi:hypothetical protein